MLKVFLLITENVVRSGVECQKWPEVSCEWFVMKFWTLKKYYLGEKVDQVGSLPDHIFPFR